MCLLVVVAGASVAVACVLRVVVDCVLFVG